MRNKMILGVVSMQIIILLAIFVPQQYKVITAQHTVRLQTVPVDPTDLMRGHYAEVEYKISTLNYWYNDTPRERKLKNGDVVYVVLVKKGNVFSALNEVTKQPPLGKIFIKGVVDGFEKKRIVDKEDGEDISYDEEYIKIKYGIEKIFISEAKAKNMEWLNKPYIVTTKIGPDGEAKALSIDSESKTKKN